jgi:hypothetical protein
MWADRDADPPRCPGSGLAAEPARPLPDGFPHGRALCPECTAFVAREDGRIAPHDAFRAARDPGEAASRAAWFNTRGWG